MRPCRKVSYKQKHFEDRGDTKVFQNRSADGAHEPGELTQGSTEIPRASDLTWSLLCAFDFVVQSDLCVSVKSGCPWYLDQRNLSLHLFFYDFFPAFTCIEKLLLPFSFTCLGFWRGAVFSVCRGKSPRQDLSDLCHNKKFCGLF